MQAPAGGGSGAPPAQPTAGTTPSQPSGAGTHASPSGGTMAPSTGGNTAVNTAGQGGTVGAAGTSGGTAGATAGISAGGAGGMMAAAGTDGAAGKPPEMITCPATVAQPGDSNGTVMVGGQMRQYMLHVPASYDGTKPMPLVTDWHPILTDYNFEKRSSGYGAKGDKEGFMVAWPNGIDNAWNVGPCCTTQRSVDDVAFAKAMIDKIKSQYCVDTKRIYAVGYSMGGGMSYKLACDAADVIAAVSPAAFELMEENEWPCHPSRPITVISFNGTADFIVPYRGGASNPPNGLPVTNHFLGAEGTFKKWQELNGCTGTPTMNGECTTYTQCAGGVETTACVKQGGGHSAGDPDVAWETLKRFALP